MRVRSKSCLLVGFCVIGLAVGLRVLDHALGLQLGNLVGLKDGGVVVQVGEKVGQHVGR